MAQSINLIPQKEVQEQVKVQVLKFSTVISIVALVVVTGVTVYFVVTNLNLKRQIGTLDTDIATARSSVKNLSNIEVNARNLDKKYKVLNSILENRVHFSMLVDEIYARKPDQIEIVDFNVRDNSKINIAGKADTYISVADFTTRLLDKGFVGGNSKLKDLFSEATLNSVNLENRGGGVNFSSVIQFNQDKLR